MLHGPLHHASLQCFSVFHDVSRCSGCLYTTLTLCYAFQSHYYSWRILWLCDLPLSLSLPLRPRLSRLALTRCLSWWRYASFLCDACLSVLSLISVHLWKIMPFRPFPFISFVLRSPLDIRLSAFLESTMFPRKQNESYIVHFFSTGSRSMSLTEPLRGVGAGPSRRVV